MHTLAILLLLVLAGPAQRIETQYPDRGKVTRLETAMNHLTVIELSDTVTLNGPSEIEVNVTTP